MSDTDFWRNRIVESGAADPQELAKGMNPLNWRGHPEAQREALEEALESIGFLQRVLVNRSSGRVIDGHLRIELAVLKGQPLIPVDYVELSEDEEALALATLDAITEQAEPIPEKLAVLFDLLPTLEDAHRATWEVVDWPIKTEARWKMGGYYRDKMLGINHRLAVVQNPACVPSATP